MDMIGSKMSNFFRFVSRPNPENMHKKLTVTNIMQGILWNSVSCQSCKFRLLSIRQRANKTESAIIWPVSVFISGKISSAIAKWISWRLWVYDITEILNLFLVVSSCTTYPGWRINSFYHYDIRYKIVGIYIIVLNGKEKEGWKEGENKYSF